MTSGDSTFVSSPFRDPTSLTRWTRNLLYVHIAVALLALASGFLEYRMLVALDEGAFASREAAIEAAQASDRRQGLVGVLQLLVFIVSGFLVLRWIHRMNANARALGATGLKFTPGWSIGWYFVPFANLWKPYQAMKEIWRASASPGAWQTETVPPLLGQWWLLWVAYVVTGNLSLRLALRAREISELIGANIVAMISDALTIPLCIVFLPVVARIARAQSDATGPTHRGPSFPELFD